MRRFVRVGGLACREREATAAHPRSCLPAWPRPFSLLAAGCMAAPSISYTCDDESVSTPSAAAKQGKMSTTVTTISAGWNEEHPVAVAEQQQGNDVEAIARLLQLEVASWSVADVPMVTPAVTVLDEETLAALGALFPPPEQVDPCFRPHGDLGDGLFFSATGSSSTSLECDGMLPAHDEDDGGEAMMAARTMGNTEWRQFLRDTERRGMDPQRLERLKAARRQQQSCMYACRTRQRRNVRFASLQAANAELRAHVSLLQREMAHLKLLLNCGPTQATQLAVHGRTAAASAL